VRSNTFCRALVPVKTSVASAWSHATVPEVGSAPKVALSAVSAPLMVEKPGSGLPAEAGTKLGTRHGPDGQSPAGR
jgi:hypothetical protein